MAVAALRFAAASPDQVTDVIAPRVLALATLVIAEPFERGLFGLARGALPTFSA